MNITIEKPLDGSEITYTEFPPDEEKMIEFFKELFEKHWQKIVFGPCVDGAVFEIRLSRAPKSVKYSDGYLTIDTGPWHFHLCLGHSKVSAHKSEELARHRCVARAAFFESKNKSCVPKSFGFRMWNGTGDQMISIFFPNPYLSDQQKVQKPDWDRLKLWTEIKEKYAGTLVE